MMTATLSQQMAGFLADDITQRIGGEIHALVETAFLDTAACILSGRDEPVTRLMSDWLAHRAGHAKESSALFSEQRMESVAAASLNALSGHALDFDDVALAGHPSVVLVPVLLAEAERTGQGGSALVQAYVKGYQIWADLLQRLADPLHEKGWHPTAVLGTVGVAAATCAMRGVGPVIAVHALGLAASQAAGLVANFGTMAKPMHAYWAVEKGMRSVELAQLGITASMDALDGPTGLLTALSASRPPERSRAFSGLESLAIDTVRPSIKKYPICYAGHRVVDGVLDLRAANQVEPSAVRAIHAHVSPTNRKVLKYARPTTPLEAKFSTQFACASALAFGEVSLRRLNDDAVSHPVIARLMPLVQVHDVERECPLEPSFAFADRVVLELADGTRLDSGDIRFARGHAQLPLHQADIEAKILQCVAPEEQAWAADLVRQLRDLVSRADNRAV
ncbi:MmgE/PrpD family protein [Cupriavidus necator]